MGVAPKIEGQIDRFEGYVHELFVPIVHEVLQRVEFWDAKKASGYPSARGQFVLVLWGRDEHRAAAVQKKKDCKAQTLLAPLVVRPRLYRNHLLQGVHQAGSIFEIEDER